MLAVGLYLGSYETFYVSWLREVRENACNLSTFRNPNSFLYQFEHTEFAINLKFHIWRKIPFLNAQWGTKQQSLTVHTAPQLD